MSCCCLVHDAILGACILGGGPRVARTEQRVCENCGVIVRAGEKCVDHAGLWTHGEGWCIRFHEECFELMLRFADKECDSQWCAPFDLEMASQHAMLNGHDPFWKEWLLLYEKTWKFSRD